MTKNQKNNQNGSTSSVEASDSSASSTCSGSNSPTSSASNCPSSSLASASSTPKRASFLSIFKLNTLNNLSCALFVFLLQLYIIYERFSLLQTLNSLSLSDTFLFSFNYVSNVPSNKFQNSIIINGFLVTFGLIFAFIAFLLGIFKLGIYSHDSFVLGKNFDKSKVNKELFSHDKIAMISIVSTGSDAASDTSTENSKKKLTKRKASRLSRCSFFKKPIFWSELPPIGVAFHLLAAFFLLVSEVSRIKVVQLIFLKVIGIFITILF